MTTQHHDDVDGDARERPTPPEGCALRPAPYPAARKALIAAAGIAAALAAALPEGLTWRGIRLDVLMGGVAGALVGWAAPTPGFAPRIQSRPERRRPTGGVR